MRSLPQRLNPLILQESSPTYDDLLSRRRLGKTNLSVRPGQIGTSNATKPENLGMFEYAHLKAPLPKDLSGSEIFANHHTQKNPETYFLMRRSKDGYVSATGMFKIAFPWAQHSDEKNERDYLKKKDGTSEDEIAGNVWITPALALELAEEYCMSIWVRALLDPSEIAQNPASAEDPVSPPPKFEAPPIDGTVLAPPTSSIARNRTRRSASPTKIATPSKKTATPRRSRQTRAQKEAGGSSSSAANASLHRALSAAASNEEPKPQGNKGKKAQTNGERHDSEESQEIEVKKSKDDVKVSIETSVDSTTNNVEDEKDSRTDITRDVSVTLPDLPPQEETDKMIAQAKAMVEEASKPEDEDESAAVTSENPAKKRKPDELEAEVNSQEDVPSQPPKRARVLEDKLRRERVRNRALVGVTAGLAFAAAIPYFF